MAHDGQDPALYTPTILDDLLELTAAAVPPVQKVLETATARVRSMVSLDGKISGQLMEEHQTATHGLAWLATYAQSLKQMQHWAETLQGDAPASLCTQDGAPIMVGDDRLYYLAGWPDVVLWDRIIETLAPICGIELLNLPEGLRLRDTATHRFVFNYNADPITWKDIMLAPAGVHWHPL